VVDVNSPNQRVAPEYDVNVDPTRAADLGVSAQTAGAALAIAVSGQKVSTFQRPGQSNVDIRLIGDAAFRVRPDNLRSLPLHTANGTIVRLSQMANITRTTAPNPDRQR
jgi:multidrug efflux pump subunit AcrB